MALDSSGNVFVDFVWGRMAMQPNDERGDGTPVVLIAANGAQNKGWSGTTVYPSGELDVTLGDHSIITAGYSGYPGFIPNDNDDILNTIVPSIVGLTLSAAGDALEVANLVGGDLNTTDVGATEENDGKIKTQSPAAGTVVNQGTAVDVVVFEYTAPEEDPA